MNIVEPQQNLQHAIRSLTGPGFSQRNVTDPVTGRSTPKGWARTKYERLLSSIGPVVLTNGVPLKYVTRYLAQPQEKLKVTASLHNASHETLIYLDLDTHDGKGKAADCLTLLKTVRHCLPHGAPLVSDRGVSAWVRVAVPQVYKNRGIPVCVSCLPAFEWFFAACGLEIEPGSNQFHPWHCPSHAEPTYFGPWEGNKIAENIARPYPLPYLGQVKDVWPELCGAYIDLRDKISPAVKAKWTSAPPPPYPLPPTRPPPFRPAAPRTRSTSSRFPSFGFNRNNDDHTREASSGREKISVCVSSRLQ